MNLMMLLEMAAQGFGDRAAIQNGGESLTYAELFEAAGAAAREIQASGATRASVLDVSSLLELRELPLHPRMARRQAQRGLIVLARRARIALLHLNVTT